MNPQLENQQSGYIDTLGMSLYDDETILNTQFDSHVHLHGSNSFSSDYAAQSINGYNYDPQSLSAFHQAPQTVDMVRRHSDFYPMSEAMSSPQYYSFSLNQESTPLVQGTKSGLTKAAAASQCVMGQLQQQQQQQSYRDSSPSSMESSYQQTPVTSPTKNFTTTTSAVPQARKKRNKCSDEQVAELDAFFLDNRNPTGKIREELSRKVQIPERSVQVWFQNKRAKTKINEIRAGVPLEQRTTVSREQRINRPVSAAHRLVPTKKRRNTHGGDTINNDESAVIHSPSSTLCIGEWRRMNPLVCIFSRRNQSFTWCLSSESISYKLECPLSSITKITFSGPTEPSMHDYSEGVIGLVGHLTLELSRPPQFYMEVFRSSGNALGSDQKHAWRQCVDFTEKKEATTTLRHTIRASYHELRQAVSQIYKSGGRVSDLLEIQVMDIHHPYNLDSSTSALFSPSSHQLNFADFNGQDANFHHQQITSSLSQSSHQLSSSGSVPNSSTDLNFTGLQIETPRTDSFSVEQHQPHTSSNLQSYSWQQQPIHRYQQIDPLSVSWNIAEQQGHQMTAFGGSITSAPAYEATQSTFADQQHRQFYHRASLGDIYSSLGNLYTPQGIAGDTIDEVV